jgi:hypothetical protein
MSGAAMLLRQRQGVRPAIQRSLQLAFDAEVYVVERGESIAVTITLARENITDAVTLSVSGLPAGTTGTLSPTTLEGATLVSTLTIASAVDASLVNLQSVLVSAATPLGATTSRAFLLTVEEQVVEPGAQFVLSASATAFNVVRDAAAFTTVSMVRGVGFTAAVALAIDETLPSGVTVEFGTTTLSGDVLSTGVTFLATDAATLGSFTATVRGTASGTLDNTVTLTVNVVDGARFGVNLIPHTQRVTTWGGNKTGDRINLEIDTLARYVARLRDWAASV